MDIITSVMELPLEISIDQFEDVLKLYTSQIINSFQEKANFVNIQEVHSAFSKLFQKFHDEYRKGLILEAMNLIDLICNEPAAFTTFLTYLDHEKNWYVRYCILRCLRREVWFAEKISTNIVPQKNEIDVCLAEIYLINSFLDFNYSEEDIITRLERLVLGLKRSVRYNSTGNPGRYYLIFVDLLLKILKGGRISHTNIDEFLNTYKGHISEKLYIEPDNIKNIKSQQELSLILYQIAEVFIKLDEIFSKIEIKRGVESILKMISEIDNKLMIQKYQFLSNIIIKEIRNTKISVELINKIDLNENRFFKLEESLSNSSKLILRELYTLSRTNFDKIDSSYYLQPPWVVRLIQHLHRMFPKELSIKERTAAERTLFNLTKISRHNNSRKLFESISTEKEFQRKFIKYLELSFGLPIELEQSAAGGFLDLSVNKIDISLELKIQRSGHRSTYLKNKLPQLISYINSKGESVGFLIILDNRKIEKPLKPIVTDFLFKINKYGSLIIICSYTGYFPHPSTLKPINDEN